MRMTLSFTYVNITVRNSGKVDPVLVEDQVKENKGYEKRAASQLPLIFLT